MRSCTFVVPNSVSHRLARWKNGLECSSKLSLRGSTGLSTQSIWNKKSASSCDVDVARAEAERVHVAKDPRAGPPVTRATRKSPSSARGAESRGTKVRIVESKLDQRSQLDTAHERQKRCLRTVDGASMRRESNTKRRGVVSRNEIKLRCGSVTRAGGDDDDARPSGLSASSHTARQCCTRKTSSSGIALRASRSSRIEKSAPVVNSVIPLKSQSGARMQVSAAKVRHRKLGALPPKSVSGSCTGGPLS
jgi:hypothetical protein